MSKGIIATKRRRGKKPPRGSTINRTGFVALCAEGSAYLNAFFLRLQEVLAVLPTDRHHPDLDWIDRDRLTDVSHLVEKAAGMLGIMPFSPEADLPNPIDTFDIVALGRRAP